MFLVSVGTLRGILVKAKDLQIVVKRGEGGSLNATCFLPNVSYLKQ